MGRYSSRAPHFQLASLKIPVLVALIFGTVIVVVLAARAHNPGQSTRGSSQRATTDEDRDIDLSGYKLVFNDEFRSLSLSAASPKGPSTWYLYPPYGVAGNYSESTWDASMLSVSEGVLSSSVQEVGSGAVAQKNWRTGNLSSVDTTGAGFAQRFGYFEAKMQMPTSGTGSWPAFWLLSTNAIPYPGPVKSQYAEVDILEWYGVNFSSAPQRAIVSQASHNYSADGKRVHGEAPSLYEPETKMPAASLPWRGFHIYGVNIQKDFITWYIDGQRTNRVRNPSSFTSSPFFMMIDYALGGGYGLGGVQSGSRLQVDWVRAYAPK